MTPFNNFRAIFAFSCFVLIEISGEFALFLLVHLIDGIFLCVSFSVEISASISVGYQQTIGEEFDIGKLWC